MIRIAFPVAALALAGPVAAQEKPATAAQIVEAIDACKAITSADWIDLKKLPALGWTPFSKSTGTKRMKIAGAYEKKANDAIVVIGRDELATKTCVVVARLASGGSYGATAQGVSQIIGMPTGQQGFTYTWDTGEQRITLDPSGDKTAPKARFAVAATTGETQ